MGAFGLCSTSWKQEQLVSKCPWGYSRDADQGHIGTVQPACRVLVACMITIFVFVFNFKYLPKCGCQHNSPENPDFCLHLKTWRLWSYGVHFLQGGGQPLTGAEYSFPHFLLFLPCGPAWAPRAWLCLHEANSPRPGVKTVSRFARAAHSPFSFQMN